MAKLIPLTKIAFINGYLFTMKDQKSEQFYLVWPKGSNPHIINGFDKQIYAYVEHIFEDGFIVKKMFFGNLLKLKIKFDQTLQIIN